MLVEYCHPPRRSQGGAPVLPLEAAVPEGGPQGGVPDGEGEAASRERRGLQRHERQQQRQPEALPERGRVPAAVLNLLRGGGAGQDGRLHSAHVRPPHSLLKTSTLGVGCYRPPRTGKTTPPLSCACVGTARLRRAAAQGFVVLLRARYLPSTCMCRGPRGDPGANTDDTQPWVGIHLARPQRSKVAQTGWQGQQRKLSAVGMSVLGCKGGEAITGQNWWGHTASSGRSSTISGRVPLSGSPARSSSQAPGLPALFSAASSEPACATAAITASTLLTHKQMLCKRIGF